MKVHLFSGSKVACTDCFPFNAMFTINKKLVTCLKCRKSKAFKGVSGRKQKRRSNEYQPGLFE